MHGKWARWRHHYIKEFPAELFKVHDAVKPVTVVIGGHSHWWARFVEKYGKDDPNCKALHALRNGQVVHFKLTESPKLVRRKIEYDFKVTSCATVEDCGLCGSSDCAKEAACTGASVADPIPVSARL